MRWAYGTPLTLETEHYSLTSVDPDNIPDEFVTWFADPEIMRFMNDPMNLDKQQLGQYFSTYNNKTRIALLIRDKGNQRPVGIFKVYVERPHARCHTSVLIGDRAYWGKGVVIEVRERIIRFLFTAYKLEKICGFVRARNFPALFNYTKQKFVKEGVLRKHMRNHDGDLDDVVEFALFREDWEKDQQTHNERPAL
ncbi:GNAT family N-acetyltransferase [Sneathiella limimaris]|uniref:GNAT family N-acetyltransferase n=1 Tax=Sneathiella limimaris TaxID=1964213 RepID=UPI00146B80D9|nr:GNAT family protein [Sneathiella limimaris]